MATKKLSSKAKYIPNRLINEIEVERNGRTTTIDGADLLDGAYVKKNVKFAKGGGISQKVDKIASKLKPVALKHSGSPKEGYSVQVKDKTSGFTAWVDVWVDEEYNDVAWEWNKYIFNTDDDSDVLHSALQDNIIIAEEMSSVAILYLEDKGAIRQDNNAKWHYNKKFGNGGGVAISSESGLAVGTNADLLMNQQNLQYGSGGGVGFVKNIWVYSKPMDKKIRFSTETMYSDSWIDTKSVVDMNKKEIEALKKQYGKYGKVYIYEEVDKYAKGSTLKRGEPITMFWGVWLKDGQGYGENGNTLYRAFAKEQQAKDFIENELEYAQQKIAYVQKGKMSPPPKQQGGDRTWLRYAKGGGINMDKHIWEGWTVGAFIEDLEIPFRYHAKFKSRDEVKEWAMSNQPYYKKYIKDVVDYYWDKNATKFGNGGGVAVSSESGLAVGTNADLLMNQQNLQYRKGGGLKNKAKYIPNRLINEMEVERNGRTTTIDGADLLDGAYVKKNVKFAKGSTVKSGSELPYYVYNHETNTIEKEFDNEIEAEEFATKFKNADVYINDKYAKGSTIKGGKFNLEEFNDWWFDGGEETADEEYGELVTKALLKKQPSYPNEANAYSEALWELAKKDNAHKKFANGGGVAVSSESGLAVGTNADLLMNQQNLQYRKGGGLKNKAKYIPNRLINEIEVERNGRTTTIDGADLLDGAYVKKNVKFAKGSTVNTLKPIKVKAYGMDKRIVSLTQKAIDFLQKKFPQYRGEEELDSTEPYWDMVDAVRENFDTDTPTKYGEIGEEIVRMYLDKENKYAKGSTVKGGLFTIEKGVKLRRGDKLQFTDEKIHPLTYIEKEGQMAYTRHSSHPTKKDAERVSESLSKNFYNVIVPSKGEYVVYKNLFNTFNNGGGVAVSSESGLAVGTNADLLMNQQNLQYRNGGVIPNQKTDTKFDSYTAVGYAEGFIEAPSTEAEIEAWAYLIATRQAYSLQGWFGRQAESLIANGIIDRDGTINWEKVDSMSDDNYANGGNMSSGFNYSIGGL